MDEQFQRKIRGRYFNKKERHIHTRARANITTSNRDIKGATRKGKKKNIFHDEEYISLYREMIYGRIYILQIKKY